MPALRLKSLYVIAAVTLAMPALTACDSYKDDVATVQAAETVVPGKSNDAIAREIAGARGSIAWKGAKAERYNNDNIVLVTADIDRVGGDQPGDQVIGLLGATALAVDTGGADVFGQPGDQPGLPGDVIRLFAVLGDATTDNLIDVGRVDAGLGHKCLLHRPEQFGGV